MLATSREALGIEGERILPVPPLPVEDATRLFADRARAGRPDFDLAHEPAGAVAEICRRLDGLPLAIELAAARMRVMSSIDIARRLDRLRLLSGGARGAPPRQQSLAATIDWSYRLLTEPEQSLFMRLSVFAGGFDLDAAHGVCGADGATEDDTLELLTGLVDKSMVIVRSGTDRSRYGVLETLRAFGRDRLRENGIDDRNATRHARVLHRARRARRRRHARCRRAGLGRADAARLRQPARGVRACHGGPGHRPRASVGHVAARACVPARRLRVGRLGGADVVDLADRDHPLFAAAVGVAARGAWNRGEFSRARSLAASREGVFPAGAPGASRIPPTCSPTLRCMRVMRTPPWRTTTARWRAPAATPTRSGWCGPCFTSRCATPCCALPHAGLAAAQEAVEVAETTANPTARSMARYALGLVLKKSEPDRALALFDDAAELAASVQNFWWYGIALMEAAATRAVHGDPATAARMFIEVLDHWDRVGDWTQQWLNLRYVTRLLVRLGADDDAVALHHALVKAGKPTPLGPAQLADLADRLGEDRFDALSGSVASGAEAVVRARSTLGRYG